MTTVLVRTGARLRGALVLASAAWALAAPAYGADAPAGETPRFALLEFEIEGNSVLPVRDVERAVMPHLGPGRTLDDVERARAALEQAYQQAGYLSVGVDIPEQRIDGGVVRLRVVEGRVDRLRVTGARYVDQGMIRSGVPALAPGRVPDFNAVQTQLAELGSAERRIQPVLRPGLEPGTLDVELQVADELPLSGSIELNNRHAADTDPWRLQGTLRYGNLFQRDHAISLTAVLAPREPQQAQVFYGAYSAPLGGDWSLLGYLLWSDSEVEPLGAATVLGQGTTLGLRATRVFGVHSIAFGADYKDIDEDIVAGVDTLSTPVRYLPFTIDFNGRWFGERSTTTLSTQWVFALRSILDRTVECPGNTGPVDQFACKRFGGDGSFGILRGDLRHERPLPGAPGTLSARLGLQWADSPLVSAEQYSIGGAESVRGYLEAEASGDDALLGSLAWRSPQLAPTGDARWPGVDELFGSAFVDIGRIRVKQPSVGQPETTTLAGTGIGISARGFGGLAADLDLAWPLRDGATTDARDPRLHLRLSASF